PWRPFGWLPARSALGGGVGRPTSRAGRGAGVPAGPSGRWRWTAPAEGYAAGRGPTWPPPTGGGSTWPWPPGSGGASAVGRSSPASQPARAFARASRLALLVWYSRAMDSSSVEVTASNHSGDIGDAPRANSMPCLTSQTRWDRTRSRFNHNL